MFEISNSRFRCARPKLSAGDRRHPRNVALVFLPAPSNRTRPLPERLTDVGTLDGVLGGLETETNILKPSASTLSDSALGGADLLGGEDVGLLLESTLGLDGEFGGHGCYLVSGVSKFGSEGGEICRWARVGLSS